MNNANQNPVEQVAVDFVETELQQARASLRRSRFFAAGSVLFVVAYMSFLTVTLKTKLLEPKSAAAVTTHYVSSFVQENGEALSRQLVTEVPRVIAQAPDYALAQIPVLRRDIENQLEATLTSYGRELTPQITGVVDQFLTDNRDAVREFLVKGSDPVSVQQLGEDFEQHVVAALAARGPDGVSANDRLADGVQAIKIGQERLHRLAYGNDLSTEEKQLRRVLGLILQQAHKPQQS